MRLALFLSRFAVLSLLCVLALAGSMGFVLSVLLTRAVSDWEWENTAAFARREVELAGLGYDVLDAPGGDEGLDRARATQGPSWSWPGPSGGRSMAPPGEGGRTLVDDPGARRYHDGAASRGGRTTENPGRPGTPRTCTG